MYLQKVKEFVAKFDKFPLSHIPRLDNTQADSLARLASSAKTSNTRNIIREVLPNPSINVMVSTIDRSKTWMKPLIKYLQQKHPPRKWKWSSNPSEESLMVWILWWNPLQKSYTHPLLKCVTPEEGNYILREIHEGGCGIHQRVIIVINKVLRSGFYWPSLRSDAKTLILRCSK